MSKLLLPLLLLLAGPALGQTVHSLDKVPGALKTPEAKAIFAQQIEGQPAPDSLGVRLPPALTTSQIDSLLVPASDTSPATIVGARPMPGQPAVYVAIVCTGGNAPGPSGDRTCDQTDFGAANPAMHVYVGLIQATDSTPPRLLAKPAQLDGKVDWQDTILGDAPDGADDAGGGVLTPDNITGFDLAPYVIAPGQRAFGLIGEWNVGYAGGGAQYHALYLFAAQDGAVVQILSTPMSFSKMLAGDWHKDGTRDHDLSEGATVLVVTPHMTDGHFDLLQKTRGGGAERRFKWSGATKRYETQPR